MNPDDPRLTAHALGQLDAAGRAEIEPLLRENPALAEEIEATRKFAEMLRVRLKGERAEPLHAEPLHAGQRAEVLAMRRRARVFSRPIGGWLALAAGVVLGIGIALLFPALNSLHVPLTAAGGGVKLRPDGSDVRVSLDAEPARMMEDFVVLNEWPLEVTLPVFPNPPAAGRIAFASGDPVLHFETKLPVIEFSPAPVAQIAAPVSTANRRNFSRQTTGAKTLREARYATAPVPPPAPEWDTRAVQRGFVPEGSADFR